MNHRSYYLNNPYVVYYWKGGDAMDLMSFSNINPNLTRAIFFMSMLPAVMCGIAAMMLLKLKR